MATTFGLDVSTSEDVQAANQIISAASLKAMYLVIGALGLIGNIFVVPVILNYKSMLKQLTNTYILNQVNHNIY